MSRCPYGIVPLDKQPRDGFECGSEALNRYLARQAGQDVRKRVAACYIAMAVETDEIAGFYTLSAAQIDFSALGDDWTKRMPRYPDVPAVRLGRLAIDLRHQGKGLGSTMLVDAVRRILDADIAAAMVVVDAKDENAARFYLHHGFRRDIDDDRRLMAPVLQLAKAFDVP